MSALQDLLKGARLQGFVDPKLFARVVFAADDRLAALALRAATASDSDKTAAVQVYAQSAASVLTKGIELNPDESTVLWWFNHERLRDFGFLTPAEVVSAGRLDVLLMYVESLDSGSTG